jgi:hypothetical protein
MPVCQYGTGNKVDNCSKNVLFKDIGVVHAYPACVSGPRQTRTTPTLRRSAYASGGTSLFLSVKQVVRILLHTLPVLSEGGPALLGEVHYGMRLLALEILFHSSVARFFQLLMCEDKLSHVSPVWHIKKQQFQI